MSLVEINKVRNGSLKGASEKETTLRDLELRIFSFSWDGCILRLPVFDKDSAISLSSGDNAGSA